MKIPRLLASLLLIIAVGGCARHEKPVQTLRRVTGLAPPRPTRPIPSITSLKTTQGLVCANCHTALTIDTGRRAIAFSHEKHLNRGFHCNQCHTSPAHGPGIMPGHPECFVCHDGRTASRKCGLCHLRRSDINPHPPNFLPAHGKAALKNPSSCRQCHTQSYCLTCHTLQMPHPPGWMPVHGQQVGEADCARCHTSQFCLDCHKLPMPHPSNWTSAHAGPGKTQTDVCTRCHDLGECRSCHERLKIMGHPAEFLMPHRAEARKPNPDCRVCHAPPYCARCHPKGINGSVFR